MNKQYKWDIDDVRDAFGLREVGYPYSFSTATAYPPWQKFTGSQNFDPSHLTLSAVQHPVLRLTLKFFSTTLFGRADHSLSRMNEVQFLGTVILPNEPQEFQDFAFALVNHLSWVSNAAKSAAIWVGGILTRIAVRVGFEEPIERSSSTLMSHSFLRNCSYMGPLTEFTWICGLQGGPPRNITFPYQHLPPLAPNRENYLLPLAQPEEEEFDVEDDVGEEDDTHRAGQAQPSVPHAAGYAYPELQQHMQQILAGQQAQTEMLQSLHTHMHELRLGQEDLNSRVARIEEENRRREEEDRRNWERFYGEWNQWRGGPGSG